MMIPCIYFSKHWFYYSRRRHSELLSTFQICEGWGIYCIHKCGMSARNTNLVTDGLRRRIRKYKENDASVELCLKWIEVLEGEP